MATAGMKSGLKTNYRLSPNEEAFLIKQEKEKRRKLRIQQVREQERRFASKLRGQVNKKKEEELRSLAVELKKQWEKERDEKTDALLKMFERSLESVGDGHRAASSQPLLAEIHAAQSIKDRSVATQRYNAALKKLQGDIEKEYLKENAHILARKSALQKEKVRAAKIASLPPPEKDGIDNIDEAGKENQVVMVTSGFSTSHYHLKGEYVERAEPQEQQDARAAAQEEEKRVQEKNQEAEREETERLEKAHLRHWHARKQELLEQDYKKLMDELDQMEFADRRRRRTALANIPHQVFLPPHKRLEDKEEDQQRLEQAFEDMYMANTDYTGDLILALEPKPKADAELDVTLDSVSDDVGILLQPVPLLPPERDQASKRFPQGIDEVEEDKAVKKAVVDEKPRQPRAPLKTLMDRIKNQREELKKKVVLEVRTPKGQPDQTETLSSPQESEDQASTSPSTEGHWEAPSENEKSTVDTLETGPLSETTSKLEEDFSKGTVEKRTLLHPMEEAARIRSASKPQMADIEHQKQEQQVIMAKDDYQRLRLAEQQLQDHTEHRDHLQMLQDNLLHRQRMLQQQIEEQKRQHQEQLQLQRLEFERQQAGLRDDNIVQKTRVSIAALKPQQQEVQIERPIFQRGKPEVVQPRDVQELVNGMQQSTSEQRERPIQRLIRQLQISDQEWQQQRSQKQAYTQPGQGGDTTQYYKPPGERPDFIANQQSAVLQQHLQKQQQTQKQQQQRLGQHDVTQYYGLPDKHPDAANQYLTMQQQQQQPQYEEQQVQLQMQPQPLSQLQLQQQQQQNVMDHHSVGHDTTQYYEYPDQQPQQQVQAQVRPAADFQKPWQQPTRQAAQGQQEHAAAHHLFESHYRAQQIKEPPQLPISPQQLRLSFPEYSIPTTVRQEHSKEWFQQHDQGSTATSKPFSDSQSSQLHVPLQAAQLQLQQRRERLMQLYPELNLPSFQPQIQQTISLPSTKPHVDSMTDTSTYPDVNVVRDKKVSVQGEEARQDDWEASRGLGLPISKKTVSVSEPGLPVTTVSTVAASVSASSAKDVIPPDNLTTKGLPLNEMDKQLERHRQQLLKSQHQLLQQQKQQQQRILNKQKQLAQRIEQQRQEQQIRQRMERPVPAGSAQDVVASQLGVQEEITLPISDHMIISQPGSEEGLNVSRGHVDVMLFQDVKSDTGRAQGLNAPGGRVEERLSPDVPLDIAGAVMRRILEAQTKVPYSESDFTPLREKHLSEAEEKSVLYHSGSLASHKLPSVTFGQMHRQLQSATVLARSGKDPSFHELLPENNEDSIQSDSDSSYNIAGTQYNVLASSGPSEQSGIRLLSQPLQYDFRTNLASSSGVVQPVAAPVQATLPPVSIHKLPRPPPAPVRLPQPVPLAVPHKLSTIPEVESPAGYADSNPFASTPRKSAQPRSKLPSTNQSTIDQPSLLEKLPESSNRASSAADETRDSHLQTTQDPSQGTISESHVRRLVADVGGGILSYPLSNLTSAGRVSSGAVTSDISVSAATTAQATMSSPAFPVTDDEGSTTQPPSSSSVSVLSEHTLPSTSPHSSSDSHFAGDAVDMFEPPALSDHSVSEMGSSNVMHQPQNLESSTSSTRSPIIKDFVVDISSQPKWYPPSQLSMELTGPGQTTATGYSMESTALSLNPVSRSEQSDTDSQNGAYLKLSSGRISGVRTSVRPNGMPVFSDLSLSHYNTSVESAVMPIQPSQTGRDYSQDFESAYLGRQSTDIIAMQPTSDAGELKQPSGGATSQQSRGKLLPRHSQSSGTSTLESTSIEMGNRNEADSELSKLSYARALLDSSYSASRVLEISRQESMRNVKYQNPQSSSVSARSVKEPFHELLPEVHEDTVQSYSPGTPYHALASSGPLEQSGIRLLSQPLQYDWRTILASNSGIVQPAAAPVQPAAAPVQPALQPVSIHKLAKPPPAPIRLPQPVPLAVPHELSTILEVESPAGYAEANPFASTPHKSVPPHSKLPGTDQSTINQFSLPVELPEASNRTSSAANETSDSRLQVLQDPSQGMISAADVPSLVADVGQGIPSYPLSTPTSSGPVSSSAVTSDISVSAATTPQAAVASPAVIQIASPVIDDEGGTTQPPSSSESVLSEHTLPSTSLHSSSDSHFAGDAIDMFVPPALSDHSVSAMGSSNVMHQPRNLESSTSSTRSPIIGDFVVDISSQSKWYPPSQLSMEFIADSTGPNQMAAPGYSMESTAFSLNPISPASERSDTDSQSGSYLYLSSGRMLDFPVPIRPRRVPPNGMPVFSDVSLSHYNTSMESGPAVQMQPSQTSRDHSQDTESAFPSRQSKNLVVMHPTSDTAEFKQPPGGATQQSPAVLLRGRNQFSEISTSESRSIEAGTRIEADSESSKLSYAGALPNVLDDTLQEAMRTVALSEDETSKQTGIIEDPDLTLISLSTTLTSSVVQEQSRNDSEGQRHWESEHLGNDSLASFLHHEEIMALESPARIGLDQSEPIPTSSMEVGQVFLTTDSSQSPISLQEAFNRHKQSFIRSSQSRQLEVKVYSQSQQATAFSQMLDNWKRSKGRKGQRSPKTRTGKSPSTGPRHVKGQSSAAPKSAPGVRRRLSGEREKKAKKKSKLSKTVTAAGRKEVEKEMYERNRRLYNQLEEVKQKKLLEQRQKDTAVNRQRRKEFEQKLLMRLNKLGKSAIKPPI